MGCSEVRPFVLREVFGKTLLRMNKPLKPLTSHCNPCSIASLDGILKVEALGDDLQIARMLLGTKAVR